MKLSLAVLAVIIWITNAMADCPQVGGNYPGLKITQKSCTSLTFSVGGQTFSCNVDGRPQAWPAGGHRLCIWDAGSLEAYPVAANGNALLNESIITYSPLGLGTSDLIVQEIASGVVVSSRTLTPVSN